MKNKMFYALAIAMAIMVGAGSPSAFAKRKKKAPPKPIILIPGEFRKGPYLECPVENPQTEMTVAWQGDANVKISKIEWGVTENYGNTSGNLKPVKTIFLQKKVAVAKAKMDPDVFLENATHFRFQIKDLKPETKYFYKVTMDSKTETASFRTAPPSTAKSVTFYVYGDTRTKPEKHNAVAKSMLADIKQDPAQRQTLLLNAGDLAGNNNEFQYASEHFDRKQKDVMEMLATMSYSGCGGNKEPKTKWGDGFRTYYPRMAKGNISIDYGPVHISSPWRQSSKEWMWKDLDASKKPWKIVIKHHPVYSVGSMRKPAPDAVGKAYTAQLVKHGVDVVISAHSHLYARAESEGVTFITTGGGGANLHGTGNKSKEVVKFARVYHFIRFDIDGDVMTITAIGTDGEIIDTVKIRKSINK